MLVGQRESKAYLCRSCGKPGHGPKDLTSSVVVACTTWGHARASSHSILHAWCRCTTAHPLLWWQVMVCFCVSTKQLTTLCRSSACLLPQTKARALCALTVHLQHVVVVYSTAGTAHPLLQWRVIRARMVFQMATVSKATAWFKCVRREHPIAVCLPSADLEPWSCDALHVCSIALRNVPLAPACSSRLAGDDGACQWLARLLQDP